MFSIAAKLNQFAIIARRCGARSSGRSSRSSRAVSASTRPRSRPTTVRNADADFCVGNICGRVTGGTVGGGRDRNGPSVDAGINIERVPATVPFGAR
ncbi:MAG: hypothetical protein ACU0CI_12505 [Shimia sp.]